MPRLRIDDNLIRLTLITVLLFILYSFILLPIGFLQQLRFNLNDSFLSLFMGSRQTALASKDIIVVKIDEETLEEVQKKWPWNRFFFASIIDKIASNDPKLIGIDITFLGESGTPEEDTALSEAIKKAGNIILPAYISEKGNYMLPFKTIMESASNSGFVNKYTDPDYKIREARVMYKNLSPPKIYYSFEVTLAAAAKKANLEKAEYEEDVLTIGNDLKILLNKKDTVLINYFPFENIQNLSLKYVLNDTAESKNLLKNKIVLLGTTSKTLHDIYQTPLGFMPGVFINALTLNTILCQNFIKDAPHVLIQFFTLILLIYTIASIFRNSLPKGALIFAIEIFIICASFFVASFFNWKFDYFSVLFIITLGYFAANIYKYGYLLYFSNKLKRMVMTDNVTGLATARYFQFKLQLDISKTSEAKSGISIVIFAMPQLLELFKQHKHEQSELILSQLSIILKQNSRKKADLLAKWKEDKFAAILLKTNIDEASIYIQKIISKIEENEFLTTGGAVQLNVYAGVSNYPAVKTESAAGLISCAEAASNRAKLTQQKICAFNPQQDKVHVDILKRKSSESEEDYLTMDIAEREKELLETLNELKNSQQEIQRAHFETILSLVKALEEKDQYTAGHSERVANYAVGIAKQLGIEDPELTLIRQSALLHDMGKFGLPDSILHKKEALTQEEIGEIKKHPVLGKRILEKSRFFENHIPLIVHHHEKYDGTGYPHGLSGKFIPRGAQIIAIADAIDAMTSGRGYNHVLDIQETIEELKKSEGKHFDPDYIKPAIDYLLGASKR